MKQQRFADGQPGRGRVCAYLFELANVRGLFCFGRHQGPEFFNLLSLNIKQAAAFGRIEPLVKGSPKIITTEVFLFEVKLSERVGAIDNRFNSLGARHVTDSLYRRDLTGDVYLV